MRYPLRIQIDTITIRTNTKCVLIRSMPSPCAQHVPERWNRARLQPPQQMPSHTPCTNKRNAHHSTPGQSACNSACTHSGHCRHHRERDANRMSNWDRRVQTTPETTRWLGARNSGNRDDLRGEDVVSLIYPILLSRLLNFEKGDVITNSKMPRSN